LSTSQPFSRARWAVVAFLVARVDFESRRSPRGLNSTLSARRICTIMNHMTPTTLIIAADHAVVREGLVAVCGEMGLQVVGECAGLAALATIRLLRPDFAFLDLDTPKLTGVQVLRKVRGPECPSRCFILTISREDSDVREAFKADANGYRRKADHPSEHMDATRYIREGSRYIAPMLQAASPFSSRETAADDPLARLRWALALSRREREVFEHLASGRCAKEIASLQNISPKTVDTYRASLMRKLLIDDPVGLVDFAIKLWWAWSTLLSSMA